MPSDVAPMDLVDRRSSVDADLECTIRDGGYAIDFQWPPDEIEQIVRGLAEAGFEYIEVGHGLGLGASRTFTPARCSDEEMAALAVGARGSAKIGAFFIPGVGTADDLRRFRDAGADFVRVGTDVSKSQSARVRRSGRVARLPGLLQFHEVLRRAAVRAPAARNSDRRAWRNDRVSRG